MLDPARRGPFEVPFRVSKEFKQTPDCWRGYLSYEPEGCFIAERGADKAGTATAVSYGNRFGWVGMVLVHPVQRRYRIGTTLLETTIRYLQEKGIGCVKLDATPMGRNVYVPLGFRDEYEVTRYELAGDKPVLFDDLQASEAQPFTDGELDSVVEFDAERFGARRETVLRTLHGRSPQLCFVTRNSQGITGYIMANEGLEAMQVGPWAASDRRAAETLLTAVLGRIGDRPAFLDAPNPNADAKTIMDKFGFREQRSFYRMYLGDNRVPGMPEQIYGTSEAEKG